jgi:hypothetical protein
LDEKPVPKRHSDPSSIARSWRAAQGAGWSGCSVRCSSRTSLSVGLRQGGSAVAARRGLPWPVIR